MANMKVSVVVLVCLCAFVASAAVDKLLLKKQKDVLLLLKHINQPSLYKEHVEIPKMYNISQSVSMYMKPEVVDEFHQYYIYDSFLPKGEIFSVMHQTHLKQAVLMFKLFYYAKDYDTFYKTAVWARHYLNEGLFLYSFSVAVIHRPDLQEVVLPPIYEIYPHYFYSVEDIQQAYIYKQTHTGSVEHLGPHGYLIYSNYSGHYLNLHPEQSMSYYLEDVGINAYYYYYNLYYPFWMHLPEYGMEHINQGEQYFFFHQQLLARYYLERLSNDFGEIPYFNWDMIETPYYPSLEYPNGLEFPSRPAFAKLPEYFYNFGQSWSFKGIYGYSHLLVEDYEKRINEAIDYGYVFGPDGKKINLTTSEGIDILGNLIEANPESPNYHFYGPLWLYARHLLGYSYQPLNDHSLVPSVLEHFETSLRDPAFYQMYKKIIIKFYKYYYKFQPYTAHDLYFPGVDVVGVDMDTLYTYFDQYYSDVSNAVFDTPNELEHDTFHVSVVQKRLNSKPFNYKITVKSDKDVKSVVKVFLAPKHDEYNRVMNITENQVNMVLLDYFVYDLKTGENVISKNSQDSHLYSTDLVSFSDLYKQVVSGQGISSKQHFWAFPQRYILPSGTPDGKLYQFVVVMYPYVSSKTPVNSEYYSYFYPYEGDKQFIDSYPLAYPFNKPIVHEQLFYSLPNMYFHDVPIYHKTVEEVNASHH